MDWKGTQPDAYSFRTLRLLRGLARAVHAAADCGGASVVLDDVPPMTTDSMTAQKRLIEAGIGIALSPESSTSADGGSNSRVLSQVSHESLFVDLARSVQGIVAVRVGLR